MERLVLKGALIFGVIGFATFLILIVAGLVLYAAGISCECYQHISLALIIIAASLSTVLLLGSCFHCKK